MKSFEIKITGNAKSLVDSIKSSQSAMDALIKGIDKADKKLEVLTQTGSHLSDIDKQLAKLKTDYPDIFEKIFPNIDSQINESMKPILQMPELVEQTMTKVAKKMRAIDNGSLKATDDDIKELGNDMRILGETLHLENLDMSFLDGTAKAETKIKKLIDTMGKLVEAYFNVNKAATSVDMGEVVPKKKTQKKSKNEDKPELTVNALRKKVEEIKSLSEKALDDDDAFDLVDKKTQSLIKMFKVSDDIAAKLEVELQDVDKSIEETMSKLEKMLGNQFPKAMGNAADAADDVGKKIQKLLPTSEGLEKLRIIPDGDQKAKISEYAEEYRIILKLLQQGNIESKETISALRERARTLKNIIQGVNPGDTTLDKLLTDGYGISKGTANTVASSKLSSKFKIDEFKSENISNDARQEAIDLIYHEISAENQLARKKEEAVLSYDRLIKAVERYYELQSKLDSATDSDEFDKIADEADKIADRFTEMNNASSGVFDAIQDGLGKDEALKQLADIFGIKIPEATKKAESGIKDVTSALSETSDGLAKIMYHRGNLLNSKGGMRDSFGQMPDNLTKAVENDERWKSLGFGIFGGGLFGVANPSMINGDFSKLNGSTFIQSIDLSKYNMYMADTEERAANLAKFLSQLQKFAIKREVPDFTGFDTELSGVSEESLYKQFQGVFDATDMTKEKFLAFISEMRGLLQEAGIEFDKDLNELIFKNKDSSILSSDNISTRLLKQLGYQGVYTGETSYGGFGQGSVLFDFDVTDIIGYFNTVEQATQDFQNSLKNGWTGSNEQLQQYLSNIEEISARIEAAKTKQLSFNPDFDVSAYDDTLNALNSVKENIQKVLSGESITTDSGRISGEFKTITSSAQEATSAVEGTSTAIENTGAADSSIEGLNDGVEKVKKTLEEFRALQDEILGKGAAAEGGSMDGEAIGRYTERVENAKAKLDELAKQSLLTADQIKEANDIYETAIGNLESKSRTNNEHIEDFKGREPAGSYDSGYDRGYYDARSEADSELDSLRKQLNEAEAELNRTKTSIDSGTPIDTSAELQNLENLRAKLEEVKNAIISKNKAFNDEGTIVGQVVGKEVNAFSVLLTHINDVSDTITQLINSINSSGEITTGLGNININVNGKAGDDWARVVVDAINTQGNNIVQALKIIPSREASDTINEAELIKAFQVIAKSVSYNTDNYRFKPKDFFQGIIDGSIAPEQNLAQAMQILGMLSKDLKATFVLADTGVRNLGVAITESVVVPSRQASLDVTKELAPLLDKAVDLGAVVPRILSSFNDGEKVMELQTRMHGTNLRSSKFNPEDLMNVTDKQIDGLLNTLEALSKVGLFPDFMGDNILFDKNKGFSLVDVGSQFEGWMPRNIGTFEGMVDFLKDYIYRLSFDSPFDGSKAVLSKTQANLFNSRLSQRAALAPEDRLVNFDTIKAQNEAQKDGGANVKITPIMDEGAVAQAVAENVANTPVTVKINPEIDNQDSTDKDNLTSQQGATDNSTNNLKNTLDSTTGAINDKTQAFENELETVQRVIPQEIKELDNLLNKINDITGAVNTKAEAFQAEGNAVSESVKQDTKKKKETKKKDTFDADKEKLVGVVSDYAKSLNGLQFIPDDALDRVTEMQTRLQAITNGDDLIVWKSEWDAITQSIANVSKEQETLALERQKNQLTGIKNTLSSSYKGAKIDATNVPEELQEVKTGYDDIIARINTCIQQRKVLTSEEIDGFAKEAAGIKQTLDAYTEKIKQQTKATKQPVAYKNSVMNSLQKKYYQSYSIATSEEFAISPSIISAAERLKSTWEELNHLNKEIGNTKPTEAQEIAFNRLTDEFNQAKKELDGIISSTRKLSEKSIGTFDLFDAEGKSEFDLTNEEDRKRALLEAVNTLSEGKAKIGDFDAAYKELSYTVKNAEGNWVDMKASINAAGTAIEVVAGKTKSSTSAIGQFIDQLKSKFKSIAQYLISMAGYQEIIQQIRKGIQYVKEIDSALTELKKVTDETDETYAQFLNTMSKTGAEVGATVQDLTNMAANWARLGYSIQEAGELAKSTAVLLNVSEFTDADTASEALISTMQAYGYAAEDSMHVVDVLNEIGKLLPVDNYNG
nr:MAG TPA: minor tail protein [Caudoviricetes sp.]